jgi:hypothetical protein
MTTHVICSRMTTATDKGSPPSTANKTAIRISTHTHTYHMHTTTTMRSE